jgi:hypothetical protein
MEADEVVAAIIAFGVAFWAMYLQAVLNKVGESMLWFWLAMAIFLGARVAYDARTIKYRIYGLDVKEEEVRKAAVEIAAKTNVISVALMGVWLVPWHYLMVFMGSGQSARTPPYSTGTSRSSSRSPSSRSLPSNVCIAPFTIGRKPLEPR